MIELLDGDSEKANTIMKVSKDVLSYLYFKSTIDLGITIGPNDIPFEDALIFTWIKGAMNERKT